MQLATLTDLGDSSIIGEEAHIVARSVDGPRGDSPLTAAQRDTYSNLILLCPTDHARIDDLPSGPIEFPVERLFQTKREHEEWVASLDSFDKQYQVAEEQWAALIDELIKRMGWDDWTRDTAGIFDAEGPSMRRDVYERWHETTRWIYSRIWPNGHDRLKTTMETLGWVMSDLLQTFDDHSECRSTGGGREILETARFYKIDRWNPELYRELLNEYNEHVALVEDLALEITRYGNMVGTVVREEIDPTFRFAEGALCIWRGADPRTIMGTLRPEFTLDDLRDGQPYQSPEQFRQDRFSRDIFTGRPPKQGDTS